MARFRLPWVLVFIALGIIAVRVFFWIASERELARKNDQAEQRLFVTHLIIGRIGGYELSNVGEHLRSVEGDERVRELGLLECSFGPAGAHGVLRIPKLQTVRLCGMTLSDDDLLPILAHPELRNLAIVGCGLPEGALARIAAARQLEQLVLVRSVSSSLQDETAHAIDFGANSPQLKALWLSSPPFSAASVDRLRERRPDMRIQVVGEAFDCGEASDALRGKPASAIEANAQPD